MEYPHINHLYKYYSYSTVSLSTLKNKKIWIAKPESFNDPFDCRIRFKREINPEVLKKYLELTKRGTGDYHNDLETFKQGLKAFENKDVGSLGVFSMSAIKDNILMWSHYSNHHKGFCVEFVRSSDNLLGNIEMTKPVYYSDYPEVDPLDSSGNYNTSIFQKMLFSKARDWEYEQEWRSTFPEGDKEEDLPADISAIIFGLRMPEPHKDEIRTIFADQRTIRYQQAIEEEYKFGLKIVDL